MSKSDSICTCGHPREAHNKHPYTYVHSVTFWEISKCAASVNGTGFFYPCPCDSFDDSEVQREAFNEGYSFGYSVGFDDGWHTGKGESVENEMVRVSHPVNLSTGQTTDLSPPNRFDEPQKP